MFEGRSQEALPHTARFRHGIRKGYNFLPGLDDPYFFDGPRDPGLSGRAGSNSGKEDLEWEPSFVQKGRNFLERNGSPGKEGW